MDAEKFGTFISQCRKEKQMTQAELAARLQVTDKAVSRWEREIGFPDISTILFTGIGVVFPLFCLSGSLVLLGYGIRRKQKEQPFGQALAAGLGLFLLLILLLGLFFLAGAAGIGPVSA